MDDTRKYQGKEIEALLAAAARMQQREEDHAGSHDTGLTLSEIEEIARESGIDPQFVRMAAYSRADDREAEDDFFFFGGPATVRRTVTLDRALSRTEMEELVPGFRTILENEGSVDSLEKSLSWRTNNRKNQGGTSITLQAIDGRTVCQLKASVWMPGFLIHYIPLILSLMAVSGLGGFDLAGWGLKIAVLSLVFLVTRFGYAQFYKKKRRELDEVEQAIREAARERGPESLPDSDRDNVAGRDAERAASAVQNQPPLKLDEHEAPTDQQNTRRRQRE
ncbi:MAG: hypothetical protein KDD65_12300 [Bacteroidetes bacterium]|nr:hypothetical protein [Bacteroidota bacterium]